MSKKENKVQNQLKCSFFGESVYDRYKKKIQGATDDKENNNFNIVNKVRKLSKDIDKDIE